MIQDINFPDPILVYQKVEVCFPLYQFDLSNDIDIENTISKIKKLKTFYPATTTTNVITKTGWRSPYIFAHQPEAQAFAQEVSVIQDKLKLVNSFDTNLVNLWTVIYGDEDFSKTHNHFTLWGNLAYNTILYLTDSKTPIVFEKTDSTVEILPKRGLLVAMHPLMNHSVPLVKDDSERIVMVCNFSN